MAASRSGADEVRKAIEDAVKSFDFNGLRDAVDAGLSAAGKAAGTAVGAVTQALADQRRRSLLQERFGNPSGLKAGGLAAGVAGGAIALLSAAGAVAAGIVATAAAGALVLVAACTGAATAGAVLCASGVRRAGLAGRFGTYRRVIDLRDAAPIAELAGAVGRPDAAVRKDVEKLIDAGLFRQGHVSDDGAVLMVTDDSWKTYRAEREAERARVAQEAERAAKGGLSPEERALVEKGETYLQQIRDLNAAIADDGLSSTAARIEHTVGQILQRARAHPEVARDLGSLLDYYLPLAVKLLGAYRDLDAQDFEGETIASSKREIAETLETLSAAMEKLLDATFQSVAWDVRADAQVLHAVLAQEGLVDDPLDDAAAQRARG
ncbi:MAG: 5-bromo-4-chloroindolyl phosphate hydrolysis family protein [Eggerthellaceae bacterium]|nr:5-bromo-4-chloroindolyl phosphate hydrolysis family protein [Eggerthellaceae bacterium]